MERKVYERIRFVQNGLFKYFVSVIVLSVLTWLPTGLGNAAEDSRGVDISSQDYTQLSLIPDQDPGPIVQYLFVLESPSTEDISTAQRSDNVYTRNTEGFVNPGTTTDIVWIRLDVENATDRSGEWILSLNRVLLNDVGIYLVSDGETVSLLDDSKASIVASYREYRTLAGRLSLPPQSQGQILIRYRGANWSGLLPLLATEQTFRAGIMSDLAIFLVLLGGTFTLVAIGSISFLFLGRHVVAYYALAQILLFAFYTHFTGISTVYLFPEQAESLRIVAPLTMGLYIVFICQFSRHFFETPGRLPVVNGLLWGVIWLGSLAIVLMPLDYLVPGFDRQLPLFAVYFTSAVAWLILPGLAIYATLKWQKDYWPLIVAWTSTAIAMFAMLFVWLGLIDAMPLEENIFGIVLYTEAAFLALAIALRIRVLRNETLMAERKLSESLLTQLKISERAKQLYEEREWAIQDLAEKGRLLLTAGHDTRQMISALRNYSAGLRIVSQEEKVEKASFRIDEIVENLNEVLTTAVEGSRSGGITDSTLALDTVRPEKILNAVALIHSSNAREKNIEISMRVSAGPLVTDRVLVGRVIGNFLSNAIKYSEGGRIVIACRPYRDGHRFQVWDQGSGIEPANLIELLDPKTGALRLAVDQEGLGSGMTIVKTLALRLGVRIDARSTPGRGSVFELIHPGVSLPAFDDSAEETPISIVLADHDGDQAAIFAQTLGDAGLTLERWSAPEDIEGSDVGGSPQVDLLFIDEHFGGVKGGLGFIQDYLRRSPGTKTVLLSFDRSIEARVEMTKEGSLLLYKPLSATAIRSAIAYAVSHVVK